ncbi:hypothetical protein IE81DRAFT_210782 [Ceraceosorus guamensis]|uniref:HIT-type domain-containing protein n=1 Tax=Ceraceosorus guamensis TaxID=1522189 RepID=A0A316W6L4_9BASI|nr:hypothetical protein IE81DRAFT_210782 [Ceraceosorus guamensis]PWN45274.1 hypothetical protein IE81DRAFT_210782 [Ceraceosorus guamensis]
MPSAATRTCVECNTNPSRYNCPTCRQSTCGLACSKSHKAACDVRHASTSKTTLLVAQTREDPTELERAQAIGRIAGRIAPQRPRDVNDLMADFSFVSAIAQQAQNAGRLAVQLGLTNSTDTQHVRAKDVANGRENEAKHGKRGQGQQTQQRLPPQEAKAQALQKQISYRRLPIMLLPVGMQMRKENATSWSGRDQRLSFTIDLRFPFAPKALARASEVQSAGKGKGRPMRALLHRIDPAKRVHTIFVDELDRMARQQGVPQPPSVTSKAEHGRTLPLHSDAESCGRYSSKVLEAAGLRTDSKEEACHGDHKDGETLQTVLPPGTVVLLNVYADRLRNESTAKFSNWWHAQVRRGNVAPNSLEGPSSSGPRPAAEPIVATCTPTGSRADSERSGPLMHPAPVMPETQIACGSEAPSTSAHQSGPVDTAMRTVVALRSAETTVQDMLSSLPRRLAIIEYPQLEIWPLQKVLQAVEGGTLKVHELRDPNEPEESPKAEEVPLAPSIEAEGSLQIMPPPERIFDVPTGPKAKRLKPSDHAPTRPNSKRPKLSDPSQVSSSTVVNEAPAPTFSAQAPPSGLGLALSAAQAALKNPAAQAAMMRAAQARQAPPSLPRPAVGLSGLASYASDSESDEKDEQEQDQEIPEAKPSGSRSPETQRLARLEMLSETGAQAALDAVSSAGVGPNSSSSTSGLAELARSLGWALPRAPSPESLQSPEIHLPHTSPESETPALGFDGEEEHLDWGDDA